MNLLNLKENQDIIIFGEIYSVLSKTVYVTEESADEYIKYLLSGHKVLVVIPSDNLIYFGGMQKEFEEGNHFSEYLYFEGVKFNKVASDYQLVKCVEFGDPRNVEGEVFWADYQSTEINDIYISCAFVLKTNKRADIVAKILTNSDITLK